MHYQSTFLTLALTSLSVVISAPVSSSSNVDVCKCKRISNFVVELDEIINSAPVIVFSKSKCPHCVSTKDLLDRKGIFYHVFELNNRNDLAQEVVQITRQRTVPIIFINGKHIGGNSDLQELEESGALDDLVVDEDVAADDLDTDEVGDSDTTDASATDVIDDSATGISDDVATDASDDSASAVTNDSATDPMPEPELAENPSSGSMMHGFSTVLFIAIASLLL
jgi:glutaredoxin 3